MQRSRLPRRLLALVLALALVCTLVLPASAAPASGSGSEMDQSPFALTDLVRVSIFLDAPGAMDAGYALEGIGQNAEAAAYRASLRSQQDAAVARIDATLGYELQVVRHLTLAADLVSAWVRYGDLETIRRMPGVTHVCLEPRCLPPAPAEDEAAPLSANTASNLVGAAETWAEGYTGAGSRIAIIDTGLDLSHQSVDAAAFDYAISTLSKPVELFDQADISAVLTQLNAYTELSNKPSAAQLHVSTKIPFGYNYIDSASYTVLDHVHDEAGEHGSHVAGIAAANRFIKQGNSYVDAASAVHAVGMAPDAQIFVMKVFGAGGGAYPSDYMVALEDALVLGCDAANLSLGSAAPGFAYDDSYQQIMNKLMDPSVNPKMVVAIAAGNSGPFTEALSTDLYIQDVSMNNVGNPGSYPNSLCVASADNTVLTGTPLRFGSQQVFYSEPGSTGARMNSIPGSYGFVYIDALGSPEDYEAVNALEPLSGKLVLVNRGSINFSAKGNNLISYNPKALVVANNASGGLNMDLSDYSGSFPMVSITLADAQAIKAQATAHSAGEIAYYTGTVTVSAEAVSIPTGELPSMSSFSSWGVPGTLLLKPEITAPGGSIYSINGTHLDNGNTLGGADQYELMSGTSMATPHVAGMAGLLAQYLRENQISVSGRSTRQLAQSLLMSTAVPLHMDTEDGPYYPVLQQGAGMANIRQAIHASTAVFMGEDATMSAADGKVKAELGDKPERRGSYIWSFQLHNLADRAQQYKLRTDLFTQDRYEAEGHAFLSQGTRDLNWTVSYSTGDEITVPAGGSRSVTVTVTIPEDTAALDADYPTGAYVEGYTFIESQTSTEDGAKLDVVHSIPILGFYGSWTDPSMFDNMSYIDTLYGETRTPYSGVSDTNYLSYTQGGSTYKVQGNPYETEEPFPAQRLAIRSDAYLYQFRFNLVRSAGSTGYAVSKLDANGKITQALTAKVLANEVTGMYYSASSAAWQNAAQQYYTLNKTVASLGAATGDRVRIGFYAVPEYNAWQMNPDKTVTSANSLTDSSFKALLERNVLGKGAMVGWDFYVDDSAPVIKSAFRLNDSVIVTVQDDNYLARLALTSADGRTVYASAIPPQSAGGQMLSYSFDVSGLSLPSDYKVLAGDYARNESSAVPTALRYSVQAQVNDPACGSVSVMGNTVLAEPAEGYYVQDVELISGQAVWEISGSVISVEPSSDCVLRVILAPKPLVDLRFLVNGVEESVQTVYLQDLISLPETVSREFTDYSFLGWVETPLPESQEAPAFYLPGGSYQVPGSVSLHALFTRHEGPAGHNYALISTLPEELEGNYVISSGTNSAAYMMAATESYYRLNADACTQISASTASLEGSVLSGVSQANVFHIAPSATAGAYTIRPVSLNERYVAESMSGLSTSTQERDTSRWTFAENGGKFNIASLDSPRYAMYYDSYYRFDTTSTAGSKGVYLWKEGPAGTDFFTTSPVTDEHVHALLPTPAKAPSCGEAGNIAYWYCELCGRYFADAEATQRITAEETVLAPTGLHQFGTAYSSNGDGTHDQVCTVCGAVETLACSYSQTVVAPTETSQGYTLYTCVHCGYSRKDDFVPALGSDFTLSFSVLGDTTLIAPMVSNTNTGVELPSAPAPEGYRFLGWVLEDCRDLLEKPANILTGHYSAPENQTLIALYVYALEGSGETVFTQLTEAPTDWSGRYVLTYQNSTQLYAMSGIPAGSYESYPYPGVTRYADTGMSLADGVLSNVGEEYVFTLAPTAEGWSIQSDSAGTWVCNEDGYLYAADSYDSSTCDWSLSLNSNNSVGIRNVHASSYAMLGFGSTHFYAIGSDDMRIYLWKETLLGTPCYTTKIGPEEPDGPVEISDLEIRNNISLGAEFLINYRLVNNAAFKAYGFDSFWFEFIRHNLDGTTTTTLYGEGKDQALVANGSRSFDLKNGSIPAAEMGVEYEVIFHGLVGDQEYYTAPMTGSLKSFFVSQLESIQPEDYNGEARLRLAADSLLYGAKAQAKFNPDQGELLADLSETALAKLNQYGSFDVPAAENHISYSDDGLVNPTIRLSLQNRLEITVRYTNRSAATPVVVEFWPEGNEAAKLSLPATLKSSTWSAVISQIGAAGVRDLYRFRVLANGVPVTNEAVWSVESYVAATRSSTDDAALVDVLNAVLNFGDSVVKLFG